MIIGIDAAGTRYGGSFVYLKNLLEDYEKEKFPDIVEIIVWGAGSALDKIEAKAPIRKVGIKLLESQNIFAMFFWKVYLTYFLAPKQCDVLYVPGGIILPSKQKKVVMLHNLLPFDEESRSLYKGQFVYRKFLLLEKLFKYSYKKAAGVIFPSKFSKVLVEAKINFKNPNTTVIYHSVGKNFKNYKSPVRTNKNEEEPIKLLCVSTIAEYKGQVDLLDEFETLISSGGNYTLTFVGALSNNLRDRFLNNIERINVKRGVVINYLGMVEYDKMAEIYDKHDILAFPSRIESFGYPVIEAAALSKKIILYNTKLFKDTLEKFSITISANSFLFNKMLLTTTFSKQKLFSYSNSVKTFSFIQSF